MHMSLESSQHRNPVSRVPQSTEAFTKLPEAQKRELMENTSEHVLGFLREHAAEFTEMSRLYEALKGEQTIVRRDSPERILEAIESDTPIHIDFPEGTRYSNAVIWSAQDGPNGLQNAYLEGYGHANGIVTVMGVRRGAISDIEQLSDSAQRFAGLDRSLVRSIRGDIRADDILFVAVRVPAHVFRESDMTESERDRYDEFLSDKEEGKKVQPMFIHRGYLFTDHLTKH